MADAVAAVVELLTPHVDRVFGGGLPRSENENMPRDAVVVRGAGGAGTFGGGYMPTIDDRVDVRCYGATAWEALQLSATISQVLHNVRDTPTNQGRVLWARRGGGPVDVIEHDTGWDLVLTSWQVYGNWLEETA